MLPEPTICPNCEGTQHYLTSNVNMQVEDTDKPKIPPPPGAGITHPAYDIVTIRGTMVICRSCGTMFFDTRKFFNQGK